ncbi:ribosomal protein S6 kinase alpha-5-like [Ctenopharyngodon idella]|uniref:ribosomal protein S6 kinase alpha-5-like n=1 Tax=Ctenopharyngodon idella TaxID=7959 RepID=UPI00222E61BD|nr:ribosomal protein S6 kinase alpha-5-like [Ctenopharyngodon idella]
MGNNQSALTERGYTLVNEQEKMMLVKNESGDQFVIKKFRDARGDGSNFLLQLSHPHIVHHKEIFTDEGNVYLVLEHCEGGDLAQKMEGTVTFSENEVLDWIVMTCMALKYLHDQKILHKNLQPKSIFFTACGTIRLGEFRAINERSTDRRLVAPEILSGRPYDERSEIWSLGNFIEMSTQNRVTLSEDLNQLVKDTLQINPAKRPSVSEILMRPFIIKHLYEKSKQTIEELYETLDALRKLADGLEKVHFNTTVGSLTGGVVGLAGGITSVVGAILAPFTLGASLIVTGVGIGVAVVGGVTAGASNITNMVNQRANRQRIKKMITEFQEKITSTSCCIQNISTGVESLQREFSTSNGSFSRAQSEANSGVRLGRGLGGIPELVRLIEVANVGKVAAQAARAVRVAEAATGVLSALFVAVDVFFVVLDSREIHNIRKARGLRERQQQSTTCARQTREEELKSETMKFVKKIRETADELQTTLDTLQDAMQLKPQKEESGWFLFVLLVLLLYMLFIFTAH